MTAACRQRLQYQGSSLGQTYRHETHLVDAFQMRVGDCYDDEPSNPDQVADVPGKPCSELHDNEVFALFDVPTTVFPGDDFLTDYADDGCLDWFEAYVGATYKESDLAITHLVPSSQSWREAGDRVIVCVAYQMELEKISGSVRDSGR